VAKKKVATHSKVLVLDHSPPQLTREVLHLKQSGISVLVWGAQDSGVIERIVQSVDLIVVAEGKDKEINEFKQKLLRICPQIPQLQIVHQTISTDSAFKGNTVCVNHPYLGSLIEFSQKVEWMSLIGRQNRELAVQLQKLETMERLTIVDDLTDLYNRRHLDAVLETEIQRHYRTGDPFTVLFLDVDHLKHINDDNGHQVGSNIIKEVGRQIKACIRSIDHGFRYGGDEFVVILVGVNAEQGVKIAERMRLNSQQSKMIMNGKKVSATISIGVAEFPTHTKSKEEIIFLADQAMYDAKRASRNQVFLAKKVS
jgi:diguanylate cyclase (GGDEF)-like protein